MPDWLAWALNAARGRRGGTLVLASHTGEASLRPQPPAERRFHLHETAIVVMAFLTCVAIVAVLFGLMLPPFFRVPLVTDWPPGSI